MNWIVLKWKRGSSGRWGRLLVGASRLRCSLFLHFTASCSPSLIPFFSLCLSWPPSQLHLASSSLIRSLPHLSLSLSLSVHYWYRTHLWISPVSMEPMTYPLSPSLPLLFICLLHLYSFPSGCSVDKVSLHSTNGSIILVTIFHCLPW